MKVLMLTVGLMLAVVKAEVVANSNWTGHCQDVTRADVTSPDKLVAKCARNIIWAMQTGITAEPEYYTKYENLTASSSFSAFQCALWKNANDGNANSTGWACSHPCSPTPLKYKNASLMNGKDTLCEGEIVTTPITTTAAPTTTANNTAAVAAPAPALTVDATPPNGAWPWWAWALIVIGVCCCLPLLGLCCSAFLCYESVHWIIGGFTGKKPEKKKRALKKTAAAPPAVMPAPVATTAVPMPVYTAYAAPPPTTAVTTAAPVYLQAAPAPVQYAAPAASVSYAAPMQYEYAAPMQYAAPAASVSYAAPMQYEYAAPMQYAAPAASVAYAAPMQFAAEPVTGFAQTPFDMIDANHDGQISRQEMAYALR